MSFLRGNLLAQMRLLIKGGIVERPKWMDAVERVPPPPLKRRSGKVPRICFPEDPLVESYYARHPEAKLIPFKLNSFKPPIARQFAWRQLELMGQGMPKVEARKAVEAEFEEKQRVAEEEERAARREALRAGREAPPRKKGTIEGIQDEERRLMLQGLDAVGRQMRERERGS